MGNLYHQLAAEIISQIESGIYKVGDKLPGVRTVSTQRGVSAATVVAAYNELLNGGYIESRPRSGFYVNGLLTADFQSPQITQHKVVPREIVGQQLVLELLHQTQGASAVNIGAAVPDAKILPSVMVEKAIVKMARLERTNVCSYESFARGNLELRQQIAKRMAQLGCQMSVDDIVITNGCQEALLLSLKAITAPGDFIAIESPSYYGLLQIIEHIGLQAIEIPTDPVTGISLDALQLAMEHWPIKACLVVSNFSNPLGASISDDNKKALTSLCRKHKVTLIEDDLYGDLAFGNQRPSVCKRFDEKVVYCSSFSKTFAPGLRVGWVASKQLAPVIGQLKFMSSMACPTIVQYALADILGSGKYDRHLRGMRIQLAKSMHELILAIERYFPANTRITQPQGGYVLWVELPLENLVSKNFDTYELTLRLLDEKIAITPGKIFTTTQKYKNCLRLSSGGMWTPRKEKALKRVGELIKQAYKN
ncbi:GntR family transcriptional regulator [Cellvibrio zantedeschiae]|uniref:GntR family transcriptional regulator n=1 Tax=Cellvibrio zantedeschiae TaxID=1237077 RepID=A0ABQ3AY29_9GAMM|nr:PLP-dependent aminotransferase family protein [Cellvibrio zantedeschiae]GGY67461.1 GntR family transcriptional regulator [Cellvibrio zantedeschiae]